MTSLADRLDILASLRDEPWRVGAACRSMNPDLFFPSAGEVNFAAKATCAVCPVINACRDHAIHHEAHGYWGGLTERDRKQIRRARGIRLETHPDPTEPDPTDSDPTETTP